MQSGLVGRLGQGFFQMLEPFGWDRTGCGQPKINLDQEFLRCLFRGWIIRRVQSGLRQGSRPGKITVVEGLLRFLQTRGWPMRLLLLLFVHKLFLLVLLFCHIGSLGVVRTVRS